LKALGLAAGCAGLLLVAACVFSSEAPFFSAQDAAQPFEDGARFVWRENTDSEERRMIYRRTGSRYQLHALDDGGDEAPLAALFIAVPETPEDDFIAQIELPNSGEARVYAFLWPHDGGFRLIAAPRAVGDFPGGQAGLAARCAARPYGECQIANREDLLVIYREIIYPRFVTGGATPSDYMDIVPAPDAD
jgi:hypothetical protein